MFACAFVIAIAVLLAGKRDGWALIFFALMILFTDPPK